MIALVSLGFTACSSDDDDEASLSFTKEINASSVTKCPTCGGVVENGACLYCKNKYDDNSDLSVMEFDGHYGKKVFLFKNGRLAGVRVEMEPLENFLY